MNTDVESLSTLVSQSAQQDEEASRVLYEKLVERIFPFVRYRVGAREDALDITQDIFIDFFKGLAHFHFQSNTQLYAYLFVIARRKIALYYKKGARREGQVSFEEEFVGEEVRVEKLDALTLESALKELDDESREVMVLHHWSRYSFFEIGEMLGKKEATVRVQHHRALQKLKTYFNTKST